ncbi:RAP domain-containing protein, partial [Salinisphaera sp. G21_0]|uniref:RAP domain-containing protein n=1 Tax=Salinisphaera sp. G21_0 TaxID=2821094 RepID=UPI001AD9F61B
RSLTTTLHALTSAGVFTPHKPVDERVRHTQVALLSTLLDAIIFKCNQQPQARDIDARGIANQLWAIAKLVDNGQEHTPGLKEAVAALLPHVNAKKDQFIPQGIAILLWAMAKLLDYGQEQTPEFKEAVAALLPRVNAQKDRLKAQDIVNLLWAMAKLVNNRQKQTPAFKEAVVALLPLVNAQKGQFNAQHIANLLWAIATLVDNGQEWTPEFEEAVAALLPHVNAQKGQFSTQGITNMLWAMVKLMDSGQEQTPEMKEAVAALLPHVNAQKDQFNTQCIANLLWAMASLGEFVELNVVTFMFESLVYRISENPQSSQQEILMSLWGVMVCCARLSLVRNANKINVLEKQMDDLFTRLENTSSDSEEDQRIIAMAASWLGKACPVAPHYRTNISKPQADFHNQLQLCMPSLKIEEEKSLNSLSPVDLLLPDHNIVIEIQGPTHYVSGDFKTRKGSTLLKIALLKKSGFEVIEVPTNTLWNRDLLKPCIDQIKTRVNISLQR